MWHLAFQVILSAIFFLSGVLNAHDCDSVLLQNVEIKQINDVQTISWINLINSETYLKEKKNVDAGFSIFGIGASASYDDFIEKRTKLNVDQKFSFGINQSRNLFSKSLSDAQIKAWSDCMVAQSFDGVRIIVRNYDYDAKTIAVQFFSNPSRGAPIKFDYKIVPTNGRLAEGVELPKSIFGKVGYTWLYKWDDINKPFELMVNVGEGWGTDYLNIPHYVRPHKKDDGGGVITPPQDDQMLVKQIDLSAAVVGGNKMKHSAFNITIQNKKGGNYAVLESFMVNVQKDDGQGLSKVDIPINKDNPPLPLTFENFRNSQTLVDFGATQPSDVNLNLELDVTLANDHRYRVISKFNLMPTHKDTEPNNAVERVELPK